MELPEIAPTRRPANSAGEDAGSSRLTATASSKRPYGIEKSTIFLLAPVIAWQAQTASHRPACSAGSISAQGSESQLVVSPSRVPVAAAISGS